MKNGTKVKVVQGPCKGHSGVVVEVKNWIVYVQLHKAWGAPAVPFSPHDLMPMWLEAQAV